MTAKRGTRNHPARKPLRRQLKILGGFQPLLLCCGCSALSLRGRFAGSTAKAVTAGASRAAGRRHHAAADPLCRHHHFQPLPARPRRRLRAGSRYHAEHPSGARRRNAAHDRRPAGAVADQFAAQRRFRGIPPYRQGLSGPIPRRRRGAGGGSRRASIIFVGHTGYGEPAAAQQPRDRGKGVCGKEAALFQPVHRRGEEEADRHRGGSGVSRQ